MRIISYQELPHFDEWLEREEKWWVETYGKDYDPTP